VEKPDESINERVRKLRGALKISQKRFADFLGIGNTAVSKIEKSETGFSEQNFLLICTPNRFENGRAVNPEWLRSGQGEMFIDAAYPINERLEKLKSNEKELIEIYDKLFPDTQREVIRYASDKLELQELRGGSEGEERRADTSKKPI